MGTMVIAVDPGLKTGVAIWVSDQGGGSVFQSYEMTVEEFYAWFPDYVEACVMNGHDVRLVCESFLITVSTAKNTQAPWSLELIGLVRYVAWRDGVELKMQAPSVGKTFGTDAKLNLVGWKKPGRVDGVKFAGHANDAARHLMTYCATHKLAFDTETLKQFAGVA